MCFGRKARQTPKMPAVETDSSSASEAGESMIKRIIVNGTKENGVAATPKKAGKEKGAAAAKAKAEANGEKFETGMQCAIRNLYSGKEDKKGRFQWTDTIPEDIKPAEDKETEKYALLVRNIKVYNDPRRVLAIHSIVVQSPLLKKLLGRVLRGYPGVTVGLQRLEFSGKFEPLIHRWAELKAAIDAIDGSTEDGRVTREHGILLRDLLANEFKNLIDTSADMKSKGVMTYDNLWTLFEPGATVYTRQDGQEQAMKLQETKYGTDRHGQACFWLTMKLVSFDGTRFGTQKHNVSVLAYAGTRSITQLSAYPIDYHHARDELRERLVERGAKVEVLAGSHYKAYNGVGWKHGCFGTKDKYNIKERIVIDTYGWNRFNPNHAVYVTPLTQKDRPLRGSRDLFGLDGQDGGQESGEEEEYDEDGYEEEEDSGMPNDGHFGDEENSETRRAPLTTEQRLICSPLLRGYALKNKLWLNFFVDRVREIEFSTTAFENLVLPSNQKELILGFTESQRKLKNQFDDVIEGKGKGIILLLCGPPGVGKTLTAESVAEMMQVPLYMMSAGDLGLDPRNVESKLQNILEMCTKWSAILLLDEADVFLEQRSLHELERNKLVSIFLRILEYYEGIMFLTTNRVNTFDAAFQSRIHISLDYPELSAESRRTVWKNFLAASSLENTITDGQLDRLALMDMNGRQIKNVLKTAQLLAGRKEVPLAHEHVMMVLDVTQHLHNSTRETERARANIYC